MERHNYQIDGNARLSQYAAELFGGTGDLDRFAYLTQVTQARQIKRYVEHLRMHNDINRGVLFWQFNDCCPAISWSAVDYLKRPKALYYYARRFFAPVSIALETRHGLRPDLDEAMEIAHAVVINDAPVPLVGTLVCRLLDVGGQVVDKVDLPIAAQPFASTGPLRLPKALARPEHPERSLLAMELKNHREMLAENSFVYLADKYIDWPRATIKRELSRNSLAEWVLTIASDVVVKDVQIETPVPVRLSDNYFDMTPSAPRSIIVELDGDTPPALDVVQIRAVGDIA